MPKFTAVERTQIQSIVATLSIKRIPDTEIIEEINHKFKKTIGARELYNVKQRIQKEAQKWYTDLRDSRYAYLATFKERIDSFFSYQKKLHEIINKSTNKPDIQIKAISELVRIELLVYNTHKDLAGLSFNLDDRFDFDSDVDKNDYGSSLASQLVVDDAIEKGREKSKDKDSNPTSKSKLPRAVVTMDDKGELQFDEIKENQNQSQLVCYCEGSILNHYECSECGHVWCPEDKTREQKYCPKCVPVRIV